VAPPLKFLTIRTYFPIPVYPLRRWTEIRAALDAAFALLFYKEKEPLASLLKGDVKGALAGGKKR
jgi:hypothetical protein